MKSLALKVLRLLADGEFHSGVAMAASLGVSRASVSMALRGVEDFGVEVYRVHGRGYRLVSPVVWLDEQRINLALVAASGTGVGLDHGSLRVEVHDVVDSTNTQLVQRAAAGAPSGTALIAELQTRGRGRRGRGWEAGLGSSLTFSLLWRFSRSAAALGGLSLAVGLAVARCLRRRGVAVELKWPNDVLWQGRKIAGILIEVQGDALGPSAVVIGIGLNVRLGAQARARIDQPVADLAETGPDSLDRNEVLAALLCELDLTLRGFEATGFGPLAMEWQGLNAHRDGTVTMLLPDGREETGRVEGVAEDGALLLTGEQGLRRFHSGEISLRTGSGVA